MNAFHTRISDPRIGGTYMTVRFCTIICHATKVLIRPIRSCSIRSRTWAAPGRVISSSKGSTISRLPHAKSKKAGPKLSSLVSRAPLLSDHHH